MESTHTKKKTPTMLYSFVDFHTRVKRLINHHLAASQNKKKSIKKIVSLIFVSG